MTNYLDTFRVADEIRLAQELLLGGTPYDEVVDWITYAEAAPIEGGMWDDPDDRNAWACEIVDDALVSLTFR